MITQELRQEAIEKLASAGKLKHGGRITIQYVIRKILNSGVPDDVAEVVTDYRNSLSVTIGSAKVVNNVINDVSRICREVADKSIVCVKRTRPYKYVAVTPRPRKTKAAPTPPVTPPAEVEVEPCPHEHFDPSVHISRASIREAFKAIQDSKPDQFAATRGMRELMSTMGLTSGFIDNNGDVVLVHALDAENPEHILRCFISNGGVIDDLAKAVISYIRESKNAPKIY